MAYHGTLKKSTEQYSYSISAANTTKSIRQRDRAVVARGELPDRCIEEESVVKSPN